MSIKSTYLPLCFLSILLTRNFIKLDISIAVTSLNSLIKQFQRMKTDMNHFETLTDSALLSKIDKLFVCSVDKYITLSQLMIVRNQLSDKSSVLEELINLSFSWNSGLCTQFATQITFQWAQTVSISMSVIFAEDANQKHVEMCKKWVKTDLQTLNLMNFSEIIKEVYSLCKRLWWILTA